VKKKKDTLKNQKEKNKQGEERWGSAKKNPDERAKRGVRFRAGKEN